MKCQNENCVNEAIDNLYICDKCMDQMAFMPIINNENQCANGCICDKSEEVTDGAK